MSNVLHFVPPGKLPFPGTTEDREPFDGLALTNAGNNADVADVRPERGLSDILAAALRDDAKLDTDLGDDPELLGDYNLHNG